MQAKREYRDRDEVEVAVLDALVERREEGMTVLELRSSVDAGIDQIESALPDLKEEGLIRVENEGERTRLYPDPRVVPETGEEDPEPSLVQKLRERLPL